MGVQERKTDDARAACRHPRSSAGTSSNAVMPAATRKADPLHVDVPPNLVQELKAEVLEDLRASHEVADEMIWALGGEPLCFERFLVARNLNVAAAAQHTS